MRLCSVNDQVGGGRERTVAHIRRGPAIHISRHDVIGRESKVSELHKDLALLPAIWRFDPSIGDDKVLRFDVPVEDVYGVTNSDGLAHLSEHGGDEAQASARK